MGAKCFLVGLAVASLVVCFSSVGRAVEDETLVLFMSFDKVSGDMVEDESGNGNSGILEGDAEITGDGKFGSALSVGVEGHVIVKDSPSLDGMSELTVEMWLNVNSVKANAVLVAKALAWGQSFLCHIHDNGTIYWGYSWPDDVINAPAGTAVEKEWIHLAFWFDGDDQLWKIYKNGEEVASGPAGKEEIPDTDKDLFIAVKQSGGIIDELAIYRRALTEEEIGRDMKGIEVAAVQPSGKVSTTWADIKTHY